MELINHHVTAMVVMLWLGRIVSSQQEEESNWLVRRCSNGRCLTVEMDKLNMVDAMDFCRRERGGDLVTTRNTTELETLARFMEEVGYTEVWIGLIRRWNEDWEVPRSRGHGGSSKQTDRRRRSPPERPPSGPSCAYVYFDHMDMEVSGDQCDHTKYHICVKPANKDDDSEPCQPDYLSCGSYCLSYVEDKKTWYMANQECIAQGGGLYNVMQPDLNLLGCLASTEMADAKFWTIHSNVQWLWMTDGMEEEVNLTFWHDGYPRYDERSCAKLRMRGQDSCWQDEDCDKRKLHFVCQAKDTAPDDDEDATTIVDTTTTEEVTPQTTPSKTTRAHTPSVTSSTVRWPRSTKRTTTSGDSASEESPEDSTQHDVEDTTTQEIVVERGPKPTKPTNDENDYVLYIALGAVALLVAIVVILSCVLVVYVKRHKKSTKKKNLMDETKSSISTMSATGSRYDVIGDNVSVATTGTHPYRQVDVGNTYEHIPADYEDQISPRYVDIAANGGPIPRGRDSMAEFTGPITQEPEYVDIPRSSEDTTTSGGYLCPVPSVRHNYEDLPITSGGQRATEPGPAAPGGDRGYVNLVDPEHNVLSHTYSSSDSIHAGSAPAAEELSSEETNRRQSHRNTYMEIIDGFQTLPNINNDQKTTAREIAAPTGDKKNVNMVEADHKALSDTDRSSDDPPKGHVPIEELSSEYIHTRQPAHTYIELIDGSRRAGSADSTVKEEVIAEECNREKSVKRRISEYLEVVSN